MYIFLGPQKRQKQEIKTSVMDFLHTRSPLDSSDAFMRFVINFNIGEDRCFAKLGTKKAKRVDAAFCFTERHRVKDRG